MSHSTISARAYRLLLLLALGLLAACGPSHVVVEGRFPEPLVQRQPIDIALYFDETFRSHEFSDEGTAPKGSSWVVHTGKAQVEMWDVLLGGLFQSVTYLDAHPSGVPTEAVDAVLIPHVEELQYAIPAHTNVKIYEIWMRYRFELLTPEGESIGDWQMTSYGKTPTAFLRSDEEAVNLAAVMALRDAGAHFITTFHKVPQVRNWLREHGAAPPQGDPTCEPLTLC